jgi:hypothetical protein
MTVSAMRGVDAGPVAVSSTIGVIGALVPL